MLNGETVEAVEMDFDISKEDWSEYKLLDGGIIRVKTTVTRIFKVSGGSGRWAIQSNNTVVYKE